MNKLIQIRLLDLKESMLTEYKPIEISKKSMKILLDYSNEIPYELHGNLRSLLVMDMGDEFVLPKDKCVQIIERLLIANIE